ncbi:MAG: hypothetical protein JO172_03065 [Hyphomicrobiales bacterium]|nr:hypothetical protein [Hyphomicrobiales bacterium]
MNRETLEGHLASLDHEIARNELHMRRQRELIAKLENEGEDAAAARELLATLEGWLAFGHADRELSRQELALCRQRLKKIW